MNAPFDGHLYRIEGDAARLALITNFYALRDAWQIEQSERILDLGGGFVLCTLAPDAIRIIGAWVATKAEAA